MKVQVHSPQSTVHGKCRRGADTPVCSEITYASQDLGDELSDDSTKRKTILNFWISCGRWTLDRGLSIVLICLVCLLLPSCDDPEEFPDTYREDVIDYFQHVALGFEFGDASEVTRKWNTDMKLFIGGTPDQALRSELDRIIGELNELTAADGFGISITTDTTQCNAYIFFGSKEKFAAYYPNASANDLDKNLGLFYVKFDGTQHFFASYIFIDLIRNADVNARKHLIREELTQTLGLARDSYEYPASIFYQGWTTGTEFAPIDRDLIRLLYNPQMSAGLDAQQVAPVLDQLTTQLAIGQ